MPIYEYVCSGCDTKFELLRSFSQADESARCPECNHDAEKVLSAFACFTTNDSGMTTSLGDSGCASCGTASCATCATAPM